MNYFFVYFILSKYLLIQFKTKCAGFAEYSKLVLLRLLVPPKINMDGLPIIKKCRRASGPEIIIHHSHTRRVGTFIISSHIYLSAKVHSGSMTG